MSPEHCQTCCIIKCASPIGSGVKLRSEELESVAKPESTICRPESFKVRL